MYKYDDEREIERQYETLKNWIYAGLLLLAIVVISIYVNMIFFTAVEYTTHSAVQEYINFNPWSYFRVFVLLYIILGVLSLLILKLMQKSGSAAKVVFLILGLFYTIHLYYVIVGTLDISFSDRYVWWMKSLAILIDCFVIINCVILLRKQKIL
ncbi:MAG: hypothetical protein WAO24_02550 [Peptococcia bacterium]